MSTSDSLEAAYARKKEQYIRDCDLCGICVDACPVLPMTSLAALPASDVQARVIDVLRDGQVSDEAIERAAGCSHCHTCRDTCPQDINPTLLQEMLQLELVKLGQKGRPLMEFKIGETRLFVPDMVAAMQVKPEDKFWLSHVPENPPHKDIVVFTGCAMVMMPDKIFLIRDIFERLGLDFVIISGGEYCCGARFAGTDVREVDAQARSLIGALNAFRPDRVIFGCAECTARISAFGRDVLPVPFQYDEIFHFLSGMTGQLKLGHVPYKKATLHDPCSLGRMLGDNVSLRKLASAIPGLEIVEMDRSGVQSRCCGAVTSRKLKKVGAAMAGQVMEAAGHTGADVLVDACQGCHFQFAPLEARTPFKIVNMLSLLGEAMAIGHEDKLKKYFAWADADRIMQECKPVVEAGPYDPGIVSMMAGYMFRPPAT